MTDSYSPNLVPANGSTYGLACAAPFLPAAAPAVADAAAAAGGLLLAEETRDDCRILLCWMALATRSAWSESEFLQKTPLFIFVAEVSKYVFVAEMRGYVLVSMLLFFFNPETFEWRRSQIHRPKSIKEHPPLVIERCNQFKQSQGRDERSFNPHLRRGEGVNRSW